MTTSTTSTESRAEDLRAEDIRREDLLSRFRELTERKLTVSTKDSLVDVDQIRAGEVSELPVRLGMQGKILDGGGGAFYPIVLELPATDSNLADALNDSVQAASCEKLIAKLSAGWTQQEPESPVANYWLSVRCTSDEQFVSFIRALPNRVATRGDAVIARLKFGKSELATMTIAGDLGKLTEVTPSELLGLGVIIDHLSSTPDARASGYDLRSHAPTTNDIRDRFNRKADVSEVARNLIERGWTERTTAGSVTQYERGEECGELILDLAVFVVDPHGERPLVLRAFDLIAEDPNHNGSVDDAAAELVAEGHVSVSIASLSASGPRRQVELNQDAGEIVKEFSEAVRDARSSTDRTLPLAFSMQTGGLHQAIVSYMPSGHVKVWKAADAGALLLAAAQPVRKTLLKGGGEKVAFTGQIDANYVAMVTTNLEGVAVLPPVEFISNGPILTSSGRVASIPGYDRRAKALVVIPHRDREKWKAYQVPEKPSREQAQAAYEFLDRELMTDLPYATPGDRARHMLYILTAAGRPIMRGSVGFIAVASDVGTGKSLSLLIGRVIAQGNPGSMDFKGTAEADVENEKKLGTLIASGGRFFHCDEVVRGTGLVGEIIVKATTSSDGEYTLRRLGGNDELPASGVIVTAAGNNVHLAGDTPRRFLPIRFAYRGAGSVLGRTGFRHPSLMQYVIENRPALLAAVHTILLHGLQNKPAREIPGMGFTHDWASKVVGAASHLVTADGNEVGLLALEGWLEGINQANSLSDEWGEMLTHVWKQLKGKSADAGRIRELAKTGPKETMPILPSILGSAGGQSDREANKVWGRGLATILGSAIPVGDLYYRVETVAKSELSHKTARWTITATNDAGEVISPDAAPVSDWAPLLQELWNEVGSTLSGVEAIRKAAVSIAPGVFPAELRELPTAWIEASEKWLVALNDIVGQPFVKGDTEYAISSIASPGRPAQFVIQAFGTRSS